MYGNGETMTQRKCNHKSDLGKWKVRYYCGIEVRPEFKVTCVKCKCDISDILTIPKGLIYKVRDDQ